MILIEQIDTESIYNDIYDLIQDMDSQDIKDVHNISSEVLDDDVLNIAFDYDHDYRVMITIDDKINIEAPDDIKSFFQTMIKDAYPKYSDLL